MAKNELGTLYLSEKNYPKAVANYTESLRLNNALADQQLACNTLINLGVAYQKLNLFQQSDSCFKKRNGNKPINGYKGGAKRCV